MRRLAGRIGTRLLSGGARSVLFPSLPAVLHISMHVNRVGALLRVLAVMLCITVAAALPGGSLARPNAAVAHHGLESAASIGADTERHAADVRTAQGVELVSAGQRTLPRPETEHFAGEFDGATLPHGESRGWCDVVQCRRSSGVHLLGYSTPPPTRLGLA